MLPLRSTPREGLEPSTSGLEGQRSIQLSYRGQVGIIANVSPGRGGNTGRNKVCQQSPRLASSVEAETAPLQAKPIPRAECDVAHARLLSRWSLVRIQPGALRATRRSGPKSPSCCLSCSFLGDREDRDLAGDDAAFPDLYVEPLDIGGRHFEFDRHLA